MASIQYDKILDEKILDQAYKKLKSSVYYDKTNLILRDKIVNFESQHDQDLWNDLQTLWSIFASGGSKWEEKKQEILSQIKVVLLPKSIKKTQPEKDNEEAPARVITNFVAGEKIEVDEIQYFIDLPVEGHILGVLWVFLIGCKLDKNLQNCYGNRIRKKLYKDSSLTPTYSPYLFEPYFENYESWRDSALEKAQAYLKQGDDVLILSLDFKRFFYSVDITGEFMEDLLQTVCQDTDQAPFEKRINTFVLDVINAYHQKISHFDNTVGCVLPIGFIPSNILANCCLQKFDDAVTAGWTPLYYGRYVDDVLIVDRVEKSSSIFRQAHDGTLTTDAAISHYLEEESRWPGRTPSKKTGKAVLKKGNDGCYQVLSVYTRPLGEKTCLTIQNSKAKVFYFDTNNTDALITCFREKINKNKSEFRRMPEDDAVFQRDDYQSVFELEQSGLNKFRDVNGVHLDKFQLSKYLGKYQRISGLIHDSQKAKFIQDIAKIFTPTVIIENYILWEKIFTVLVANESFEDLQKFANLIYSAIHSVTFAQENQLQSSSTLDEHTFSIRDALEQFLTSALARALSLYWTRDGENIFAEAPAFPAFYEEAQRLVPSYRDTRMTDKSMYAIWPDLLLDCLKMLGSKSFRHINCTSPQQVYKFLSDFYQNGGAQNQRKEYKYTYYPYMVTMYDLSLADQMKKMCSNNYRSGANNIPYLIKTYIQLNYKVKGNSNITNIRPYTFEAGTDFCNQVFCVGDRILPKIRVAISSIKMDDDSFTKIIHGTPDRSYARYQKISKLVNEGISQKADLLVMPEACVPYEWLSTLARTSARNQMAIITGVEHIIEGSYVYNMTAVILPFETEDYRCAQIFFHHKNHFAPDEKRQIIGYRLNPAEGHGYELYRWNDFYFSVYCCYELASIYDRSIFQSYVDAIVAVEWNHDVNYYSNIIESLSRDIHCYCIQVNSSDYGDSRVTIPAKTERKDILRTKGGEFPAVLTATIDIKKLRDFQLKEYELQKDDKTFKPTPPEFKTDITEKKIRHTLYTGI